MTSSVPRSPDDIGPSWLNDVLGHAIPSIRFASVQLARIGEGFGLASEVYRVTCTPAATSDPSAPSTPCTFVIKLWSTEGVAGTREVAFYREFGGDPGLRIPRAFHGALDLDRARGVLVLEDIRDATQGDCLDTLDVDRQAAIARMMARFHARWWSDPRLREHSWLPSMRAYDRAPDWYSLRRRQFLERCGEDLRPEIRPWLESAPALISRSHELLADVPDTLLHGDFHLDNVLFPPTGPVILDWARVARGPAFLELADVALTGHPSAIADVFATYLAALRESGVDISEDGAIRAFTGALFRRLVVGTYGLAAWPAPSDREQRLLRDAVTRTQAAFLAWLHGRGRGIR